MRPDAERRASRWSRWGTGRQFGLFLSVSIVSHGVLFFGLSLFPPNTSSTASATVQEFDLFQEVAAVAPPPPPEPVVVAPPPEPAKAPRPIRRVSRPDPTPPATAPEPQLQGDGNTDDAPAVAEASVVSSEGGLAVNFAEGTGQGGAARGSGSAPVAPEPEPEFDLRAAIRRYMRQVRREIGAPPYPRSATRAGIEGTVMVGLAITPTGAVNRVRVKRSSGHQRLDDAALAFLSTLSRVPAPPSELEWRTREVTLPISYRLNAR